MDETLKAVLPPLHRLPAPKSESKGLLWECVHKVSLALLGAKAQPAVNNIHVIGVLWAG